MTGGASSRQNTKNLDQKPFLDIVSSTIQPNIPFPKNIDPTKYEVGSTVQPNENIFFGKACNVRVSEASVRQEAYLEQNAVEGCRFWQSLSVDFYILKGRQLPLFRLVPQLPAANG